MMNRLWRMFATSSSAMSKIRHRINRTLTRMSKSVSYVQRIAVTPRTKRLVCVLPAVSRGMGIFFCATRGTGKSRAIGRCIAYGDLMADVPLVVIDPVGGTIDNLLDKVRRLPPEEQRKIWPR